MATFTEHYDLIKPGTDDYYDVADFNENMDAIDTSCIRRSRTWQGSAKNRQSRRRRGGYPFRAAEPGQPAGRKGGFLPLFQNGNQKTYPELETHRLFRYILWKTHHIPRRKERYGLCKMDHFRQS